MSRHHGSRLVSINFINWLYSRAPWAEMKNIVEAVLYNAVSANNWNSQLIPDFVIVEAFQNSTELIKRWGCMIFGFAK